MVQATPHYLDITTGFYTPVIRLGLAPRTLARIAPCDSLATASPSGSARSTRAQVYLGCPSAIARGTARKLYACAGVFLPRTRIVRPALSSPRIS